MTKFIREPTAALLREPPEVVERGFRTQPFAADVMSARSRAVRFLRSLLDPRPFFALVRFVHFYNYDHVAPRRDLHLGRAVGLPPTVSLRGGRNIHIGDNTRIGSRCSLWAGAGGSIRIGRNTTLGPHVFITVSNYELQRGTAPMKQPKLEQDVIIGDDVWLGTGVTVLPGVTIGNGCVVGANTTVSRSLPPHVIVVGADARIVRER
jgi:acetyltransferase-like isoleucine patch superfamily enzyme